MKNRVEISTMSGERFELCYKPFKKRVEVVCLKTSDKLSFIKPIEEFMKVAELPLAEEGIYMDAEYECHSKREFEKIVSILLNMANN